MLFHSRFIEPQYEIIRNKNCKRKKSRIQFIPYQRHPCEQGNNQKYKRNYECKGYSHHAHRRFADHHHPLSYLIGSKFVTSVISMILSLLSAEEQWPFALQAAQADV